MSTQETIHLRITANVGVSAVEAVQRFADLLPSIIEQHGPARTMRSMNDDTQTVDCLMDYALDIETPDDLQDGEVMLSPLDFGHIDSSAAEERFKQWHARVKNNAQL